jgi:hypothetical protein
LLRKNDKQMAEQEKYIEYIYFLFIYKKYINKKSDELDVCFHALEEEIPQAEQQSLGGSICFRALEKDQKDIQQLTKKKKKRKGYSTDSTYKLERFPFLQASHCREAGSIQQSLVFRFENSLDAAGRLFSSVTSK